MSDAQASIRLIVGEDVTCQHCHMRQRRYIEHQPCGNCGWCICNGQHGEASAEQEGGE